MTSRSATACATNASSLASCVRQLTMPNVGIMPNVRRVLLTIAFAATLVPSLALAQPEYAKAERMLTWNTAHLVANDILSVTWLADSTRFWYRVSRSADYDFVLVDPVANTSRPVFDHVKLASAL